MTQDDLDRRSIRMHEAAAARLRADPSLLAHARANIARWRAKGIVSRALGTWEKMDGPFEDLLAAMVADTQGMRHLRRSTPFVGDEIIARETRWNVFEEFRVAVQKRDMHPALARMRAEKMRQRALDYGLPAPDPPLEPPPIQHCGISFEEWLQDHCTEPKSDPPDGEAAR